MVCFLNIFRTCCAVGIVSLMGACSTGPKAMATMDSRAAFDAQGYVKPMRVSSKAMIAPSLAYEFASAVPTTLRFETGQSTVSTAQLETVRAQAAFMRANPTATFTVFGHADASEGAQPRAQKIGQSRAQSLKAALVQFGVDPQRVVLAPSPGAAEPASYDRSISALNRRTVTELTGTLSGTF